MGSFAGMSAPAPVAGGGGGAPARGAVSEANEHSRGATSARTRVSREHVRGAMGDRTRVSM